MFEPYRAVRKASIFGSARTQVGDPGYVQARRLRSGHRRPGLDGHHRRGPGIMEAGIEGAGADRAFGVNIVLPFEQERDAVARRATRSSSTSATSSPASCIFMKESSAFALLPGGFGTMDEAFELLTLMQTGRSAIAPVVLLDRPARPTGRAGALHRDRAARALAHLARGPRLFKLCHDVDEAVDEICRFYSTYHSMRFVGRRLVLRLASARRRRRAGRAQPRVRRHHRERARSTRVDAVPPEIDDDDVPNLPRLGLRLRPAQLRPPAPARRPLNADATAPAPSVEPPTDAPLGAGTSDVVVGVVGLPQDRRRLLDRPSGPGETTLVDRELVPPASIDSRSRWIARSDNSSEMLSRRCRMSSNSPAMAPSWPTGCDSPDR